MSKKRVSIDHTRHCIHTSNKNKKIHVRIHSTSKVLRAGLFIVLAVLEVTQRAPPTCTIFHVPWPCRAHVDHNAVLEMYPWLWVSNPSKNSNIVACRAYFRMSFSNTFLSCTFSSACSLFRRATRCSMVSGRGFRATSSNPKLPSLKITVDVKFFLRSNCSAKTSSLVFFLIRPSGVREREGGM